MKKLSYFLFNSINFSENSEFDKYSVMGKNCLSKILKTHTSKFNEEIKTVLAGTDWNGCELWVKVNFKHLIIIEKENYLTKKNEIAAWCVKNKYNSPIYLDMDDLYSDKFLGINSIQELKLLH